MTRLLIIADDFTGALDSGVQFASRGCGTRVTVGAPSALTDSGPDRAVLVVDAETRHLPPDKAYGVIRDLTELALREGVEFIYKKTDSALRGNVGAELTALLDGSGERYLPFFPAYPGMGRIVEDGILYIDGTPASRSVFGSDLFEPVLDSSVPALIGRQSGASVRSAPAPRCPSELDGLEGIVVFDAKSAQDHASAALALKRRVPRIAAGCAGFAAYLPELLELRGSRDVPVPRLSGRLLIVCGSVNPITVGQIDAAVNHGFYRVGLTPRQKLEPGYWQTPQGAVDMALIRRAVLEHPLCLIDTNDTPGGPSTGEYAAAHGMDLDQVRLGASGSIGRIVGALMDDPALGTLFITGGDTLLQCMSALGINEMEPVCELDTGIVLSRFRYEGRTRYVISKSGGFGDRNLFVRLAEHLAGEAPERAV